MKVLIVGAGGHARVVADALMSRNQLGDNHEVIGFLDDDENLQIMNSSAYASLEEFPR